MRRLRLGLHGVPAQTLTVILLDYEGYFDDGVRAGRGETDLTLALGDPGRLAAELRLEINTKNWESERTLASGWRTATSALGLASVDILLLLPLCMLTILCAAGILTAIIVTFAGCYVVVAASFDEPIGGPLAAILQGVGLIAGGIAGTAGLVLASMYIISALSRYSRMHRRALRPLFPQLGQSGEHA